LTGSCLVTTSNNGYSSVSGLKSPLNSGSLSTELFSSQTPYRTDSVAPIVFRIPPRHGPNRKHPLLQYLYCCALTCCDVFVCYFYLVTALVYFLISRALHSNGSTLFNIINVFVRGFRNCQKKPECYTAKCVGGNCAL
jgi:hypothetical protein